MNVDRFNLYFHSQNKMVAERKRKANEET